MSIYYVYQYLRSDGTPYYIGKGMGRRAYSKAHGVHLPKDQTRIVMIKENMVETDAFSLEIELIAKYGRKDIATGILRNRSNGGEGPSGSVRTSEARAKQSAARKKYFEDPEARARNSAAQNTPEARERKSAARKKYLEDPENRAKNSAARNTPESRAKQSAAQKIAQNTPEARARNSAASKKRWHDPESRAKLSAAQNTPEARARNSAAQKLAWIKRKNTGSIQKLEPNDL